MLFGAVAVRRRSVLSAVAAYCLLFVAILSHTVTAGLLGVVFAGILAASSAERRLLSRSMVAAFIVAVICIAVFFVVYIWPLLRGWNQGATWGYSMTHAILGAINMIGWPIFLLAVLGGLYMLRERKPEDRYWVTCALGWCGGRYRASLFSPIRHLLRLSRLRWARWCLAAVRSASCTSTFAGEASGWHRRWFFLLA